MSNYLSQIKPLTVTCNLFERSNFGADDCKMIDCLMQKTGWKSTFVYECLKEYRKLAISKLGFDDKIYSLRTDLHHHLDKRIYLLSHFSEINLNESFVFDSQTTTDLNKAPKIGRDPWLVQTQYKSADKDALIAASLHVRDILFTASEIKTVIEEKTEEFLEELSQFTQTLSSYLDLLNNLTLEESKEIKNAFEKLYDLVKNEELSGLEKHLSYIRRTLRHSGIKNSPNKSLIKE